LTVTEVDELVLLNKRRKLRRVCTLTQHWNEAKSFTPLRVAYEPETNLTVDPGLDAKPANVYEHRGRIGNRSFESCHPGIARLQIVFVEPHMDAVAAKYFHQLAGACVSAPA
jgi:hypothetical protein